MNGFNVVEIEGTVMYEPSVRSTKNDSTMSTFSVCVNTMSQVKRRLFKCSCVGDVVTKFVKNSMRAQELVSKAIFVSSFT